MSREPEALGTPRRSDCGDRFHPAAAVGLSRLRCTGLCRAPKVSLRHRNPFFLPAAAPLGLPVPLAGRTVLAAPSGQRARSGARASLPPARGAAPPPEGEGRLGLCPTRCSAETHSFS